MSAHRQRVHAKGRCKVGPHSQAKGLGALQFGAGGPLEQLPIQRDDIPSSPVGMDDPDVPKGIRCHAVGLLKHFAGTLAPTAHHVAGGERGRRHHERDDRGDH